MVKRNNKSEQIFETAKDDLLRYLKTNITSHSIPVCNGVVDDIPYITISKPGNPEQLASKAPQTAFQIWAQENAETTKKQNPNVSEAEIQKILANSWTKLAEETKKPYVEKANQVRSTAVKKARADEEEESDDDSNKEENEVEGVDPVPLSFPVTEAICQSLIQGNYCFRAPFGRGMETEMDTTVRSTWQIEPNYVTIHSKQFCERLCGDSDSSELLKKIRDCLAPNAKRISSEFYKLLIYEKGDFFKPHRDTQRKKNHFASLIVFLPSSYSGGELLVRHFGKEFSYTNSLNKYNNSSQALHCNWVAFFTDCEHEIVPLQEGCRVALTFNLMFHGEKPALSKKTDTKLEQLLASTFLSMQQNKLLEGYSSLGMLLDHNYTVASMDSKYLKGADFTRYSALSILSKYDVKIKLVRTDVEEVYGGSSKRLSAQTVWENALSNIGDDGLSLSIAEAEYTESGDLTSSTSRYRTSTTLETITLHQDDSVKRNGTVYFLVTPERIAHEMNNVSVSKGFVLGNEGTYYYDLTYCKAALILSLKPEDRLFYSRNPTESFKDITICFGNSSNEEEETLERPKTAREIWMLENREAVKKANPNKKASEINKLLVAQWEKLEMPKRPRNAYLLFCEDKREETKKENPNLKVIEITKKLAEKWKEMDAEEKKGYEEEAKKLKAKYQKEMEEYLKKKSEDEEEKEKEDEEEDEEKEEDNKADLNLNMLRQSRLLPDTHDKKRKRSEDPENVDEDMDEDTKPKGKKKQRK